MPVILACRCNREKWPSHFRPSPVPLATGHSRTRGRYDLSEAWGAVGPWLEAGGFSPPSSWRRFPSVRFRPIADIGRHCHPRVMGYSDHQRSERNWGCIAAIVVAAPILLIWLFGNALAGFGCEGASQPCTPHGGRFWVGVAVIVAVASALGWLVNRLIQWLKR